MPLQYFVKYFPCKIYENFLVLIMWIISILPLYSYEKCRLPIFNMKAINCGQKLFFQPFWLLITAYYLVWFPYLLILSYRDPCNIWNFQPTIFNLKMQYNWPCKDSRPCSRIFRTLSKREIFRTLAFWAPQAYLESWGIKNPGIFKTLAFWEPEAYSQPCQTSTIGLFEKIVNGYNCFCK